ncbi:MAG: DUF4388 domain-containing protein [Acidobacteriota bacterium]
MDRGEAKEVGDALDELDLYLADLVPPLLVSDSVRLLMLAPVRVLAQHLLSWVSLTSGADPGELGEQLAKALTRIYQLADLQLLPKQDMKRFLSQFAPVLLDACPPDARARVRAVIGQLLAGGQELTRESRVSDREPAEDQPQGEELSAFSDSLARRLIPLLEQMARTLVQEPKTRAPATGQEVLSQLLAAVTRTADSPQQLDERLDRLKTMGLNTDVPSVLRTLGGSVPNWAVVSTPPPLSPDASAAAGATSLKAGPSLLNYSDTRLRAMQRIVELGKAPEESCERFDHMLQTAVEQFNQGAVGRAVSILESAHQLVRQERIASTQANPLWDKAAEKIQWHRFEVSLPDPVQHQLLRQFLSFFPVLSPVNLLNDLRRKEEKGGRRLLISLLQVHGDAARADVWKRLEFMLKEEAEPDWEFARDLVGVLASIPAQDGTVPAEEVKLLTRLAAWPVPLAVFRELVRFGTRISIDQGTDLLTTLLEPASPAAAGRRAALAGEQGSQWIISFEQILSRLARSDSPSIRRLVLKYCLDPDSPTGFSTAPLAMLGARDLATEPDVLARLLALLRRYQPSRWFSWLRKPKDYPLLDLVRAVSGTSSPQVRSVLAHIARRFPTRSFGVAAVKALGQESASAAETAAARAEGEAAAAGLESDILLLEGELHSFNLPSLIQHLEVSAATGLLELLNSAEVIEGTATFVRGQLFHCQTGRLRGKEALYALLEKPVFGRFRLISSGAAEPAAKSPESQTAGPLPVVPTLLEGMKRYDEYQQLRLLVPDDTVFAPTGERPGRPEGEDDAEFVRQVWAEAVFGKTAAQCEASIAADPYRTRRLLAYWVADGILREVSAANVRRSQAD